MQKVVELERRVNLILKGMNILLFTEPEEISPREKKEIAKRFKECVGGKGSEFVELRNLKSSLAQESR